MKNIVKIFRRDMKNIFTNSMAIILAVGIALLPSLYAWFNIFANWDPYGSTGNMQIAVVIEDEGFKYRDIEINVGEQIRSNLEANDLIDWQFVSKKEATDGIVAGKYYAAIEIPEGFSESLTSIVANEFKQPQITYYANEKKNAIATKITDKVVQTIQQEVNESFVTTVINVVSSLINVVADATKNDFADSFGDLQSKLNTASASIVTIQKSVDGFGNILTVSKTLNNAVSDKNFSEVLENTNDLIESGADMTKLLQTSISGITLSVDTALDKVSSGLNDTAELVSGMSADISDSAGNSIQNAKNDLADFKTQLKTIRKTLKAINKATSGNKDFDKLSDNIDNSIDAIDSILAKLSKLSSKSTQKEIDSIASDLSGLSKEISSLQSEFKEKVQPFINKYVTTTVDSVFADAESGLTEISEQVSKISEETTDKALKSIAQAQSALTKLNTQLNTVLSVLKTIKGVIPVELDALDKLISQLETRTEKIDLVIDKLEKAKSGATKAEIENIVKELQTTASGFSSMRKDYKNNVQPFIVNNLVPTVDDALSLVSDGLAKASSLLGKAGNAAADSKQPVANARTTLSGFKLQLETIIDTLKTVDKFLPAGKKATTSLLSRLNTKLSEINALLTRLEKLNENSTESEIKDITGKMKSISADISDMRSDYKNNVQPVIDENLSSLIDLLSVTGNLVVGLNGDLPLIQELAGTVNGTMESGEDLIKAIDTLLSNIKNQLDKLSQKISDFGDSEVLNVIKNLSGTHTEQLGAFLACPVVVNTDKVYGIENYGSAMAPFYSTLAIWVGAMILIAVLKVAVKRKKEIGNVRIYQSYFGRMITFLLFSVTQALIICLGDLYFLKIQCYHPIKYIFAGVLAAVAFTVFIYSLAFTFGDIGKAVGIIFLVIQIGGSGGTFPIDVTPNFFQVLNPYMPFTFVIEAMRECVCGTYANDYWIDLLKLCAYIGVGLIIGLGVKFLVKKPVRFFEKSIEKTGLF